MKCSAFAFCVFWENNAVSINNSKNKQKDISCHFKKKKSKSTSVIEEHTRNQFLAEKFDRCHWSTHTHKVTERLIKLLQQLYKNLHIVLRRKVPTNSLISHLRGSVTFCDNPNVPKIETFQLAERPKSATLATSQSRFHFEHRS